MKPLINRLGGRAMNSISGPLVALRISPTIAKLEQKK